jgi:hypothetical protein
MQKVTLRRHRNVFARVTAVMISVSLLGATSALAYQNPVVGSWAVAHGNFYRATWDFTPDGRYRYRQNNSGGSSEQIGQYRLQGQQLLLYPNGQQEPRVFLWKRCTLVQGIGETPNQNLCIKDDFGGNEIYFPNQR